MLHSAHRTDTIRSVDEILRRHHERVRESDRMFPPDFVHGDARLDELHTELGEAWAESAVFVEKLRDTSDSYAVAWFDDYFLTTRVVETEDIAGWVATHLEDKSSVVELALCDVPRRDRQGWAVIRCTRERLVALERTELCVTRETFGARPLVDARNDLLSLVCLCARLGQ